ncbi:MAG: Hsp33 family molecular chaperone HslO [Lachnospiraceae bacterium]|nr:Hsp33 family molecular chaperone HslO [Lachnospiraceae bacterium]
MAENKDYMIRATAADGMIRAFAATTRNTVEAARQAHNTSPVATAALGRLMTGALMMGYDMKNDPDLLTLRINCDGPIGGLLVTADHNGHVKGYVHNPDVILPPNSRGKLDVGGALHLGILSVIRDTGLKEPYIGETILVSGEIAEDLTYYFANSEQVPSSVALGVLMNKDNTVRQAGGFIIQLMPGASDEIIDLLESRLKGIDSMTAMLDRGMSPEDILRHILGELDLEINEKHDCSFYCGCTRERLEQALISTGRKELEEMIAEDKPIEMQCHFCGKKYEFSVEELTKLLEKAV